MLRARRFDEPTLTALASSVETPLPSGMEASQNLTFPSVYAAHFPFVWRTVCALGVGPAARDDVVQDIFVVVHRRLSEFEGRSSLRTWVLGIIVNVTRKYWRTIGRRAPHELRGGEAPQAPEELEAPGRDPYEDLARAEASLIVQQALDKLDDERREIFVMVEIEELSVPEIAQALDIKLNTAYSRLRLAREEFEQTILRLRARDRWRQP
ncbi:MAG TPA: RNA polymerase sigma factor [Polyangiaceae bacterium]|nr:RNA polymerase sigma factor [Polyangiaceae bacterium]